VNSFRGRRDERRAIENRIDKILRELLMLPRRGVVRDFNIPNLGFGEARFAGLADSNIEASLRVNVIFWLSTTIFPRSPTISNRLLPGASPVEVMKTPVARLGHSR